MNDTHHSKRCGWSRLICSGLVACVVASSGTARADPWDVLQHLTLDARVPVWLSLGGELRLRYEYLHDAGWGVGPQSPYGYALERAKLHADVHFGAHLRAFWDLNGSYIQERVGGPRPGVDEDQLDLHQAFVDLSFSIGRGQLTVRGGRQEVAYGSSRLISVREGPNVQLSFDGLRLFARAMGWQLDAFILAPVATAPEVFDDGPQLGTMLWGSYATGPVLPRALALDFYYLGLLRDNAVFEQGAGRELRHTVGARLWGSPGSFDYDVEMIYQLGSFGLGRIDAWGIAADGSYTLKQVPTAPRFELRTAASSGDRDPQSRDLQTANALFPKVTYFGAGALIGSQNHIDVHPIISLRPINGLLLSVEWDFFWRQSLADGVYGVSTALQVPGAGIRGRYVGSQASAGAVWQATRHTTLVAAYAHFFVGEFLQQAGRPRDIDYLTFWIAFKT